MFLVKTISGIFFTGLFIIHNANAASVIKIENAWSPEAPPVVKVMAGYMRINNLGDNDIKIKSAKSILFKKVEIHLTETKNGMMSMVKQKNLKIPAKSHIELKPGGLHMMLIGKLKPVSKGTIIPVTLSFDNGEVIDISLKVKTKNTPQMKCGQGKCGSM